MTTDMTDITTAKTLADSPVVAAAIDSIVQELVQASSTITEARPPVKERVETHQQYLTRQTATKGRPPVYSYVGSGIGNGPLVAFQPEPLPGCVESGHFGIDLLRDRPSGRDFQSLHPRREHAPRAGDSLGRF